MLDASSCIIAYISNTINILWSEDSFVPKKQRQGGQSSVRFSRNREIALLNWFSKINSKLNEIKPEKLLVGIHESNWSDLESKLSTSIKRSIIARDSVSYNNQNGIQELINKCSDKINDYEYVKNKLLIDLFLEKLHKGESVDYGPTFNKTKAKLILYSNTIQPEHKQIIDECSCEKKELKGFPELDNFKIMVFYHY